MKALLIVSALLFTFQAQAAEQIHYTCTVNVLSEYGEPKQSKDFEILDRHYQQFEFGGLFGSFYVNDSDILVTHLRQKVGTKEYMAESAVFDLPSRLVTILAVDSRVVGNVDCVKK